jgi:hypothetical protein
MKRRLFFAAILTAMFFFLIPGRATGQKINLDTLNTEQLKSYKTKAYKMQSAGIIITITGGAVTIYSLIIMLREASLIESSGWDGFYGKYIITGCALTGAGIPLWVVGSKRQAKAEIAIKKMNVVSVNSSAIGVGFTVRF